jgi:hypothetical protein
LAKFTPIENELIGRISPASDRFVSNLGKIREALEDLWPNDPVRIVDHYTDHGILHTERLMDKAANILNVDKSVHLTDKEMYLLLAGIYLHDIGMQCDLAKFPKIKDKAETLGAKFNIGFDLVDGKYSREMQKSIRKNHHYLTAAWIDYANRTGETRLGPAAREMDPDIVDDLIDICKYHSKLSIDECPNSAYNHTERKQFVAAILRFADELDIDVHRINIDTVKNFSIDSENSVYWWLHNRTRIDFINNIILLNLILHPIDVENYGSLMKEIFIDEFSKKNGSVIEILCKNGIPIRISSKSGVVANDRVDLLPKDIIHALQKMKKREIVENELVEEIRIWLESIGYDVSASKKSNNHAWDLEATLGRGLMLQVVLIRCFEGEINRADLQNLEKNSASQKWAIAEKRVAPSAREYASSKPGLKVFNLSDFMHEIWGPYFDELKKLVEDNFIIDRYIDLACYKQEMDELGREITKDKYISLDGYLDDWLKERGKMHISILGEFGTGKTWFCRHYAYRQLERYLNNPINERMPLLVTLRDFNKATTPQQLINDALLEKYKLHFVGSPYEIFQKLNTKGKLLLILDGFDEMAQKSSHQTIADNFWELAELVDENSKVILTSRKEFFSYAEESKKVLGGKEYGRKKRDLSPPEFEIINLEPFNDSQIRKIIMLRLGPGKGKLTADKIMKNPNLSEMARKPILVELLLAALDEVGGDVLDDPAQVYLYATNNLLLRNITTQRTFTTTADKLYFLCELAWEMIKNEQLNMHYEDITEKIGSYFRDKIKGKDGLDNWDLDLRSQTLLHRNAAGYYEFAHKSLAEYFVAYKFAAELGCLAPAFVQTYKEANDEQCIPPIIKKEISGLVDTFGLISFHHPQMNVIRKLLGNILEDSCNMRLWEIIDFTRTRIFEQVKFVGSNSATLLHLKGTSFEKADLAQAVLVGADLKGCNLLETNLENCDLTEADLRGCKISENAIKGARIGGAVVSIFFAFPVNEIDLEMPSFKKYINDDENIISDVLNKYKISTLSNVTYIGSNLIIIKGCLINDIIYWERKKNEISGLLDNPEILFYENEIEEFEERDPGNRSAVNHYRKYLYDDSN